MLRLITAYVAATSGDVAGGWLPAMMVEIARHYAIITPSCCLTLRCHGWQALRESYYCLMPVNALLMPLILLLLRCYWPLDISYAVRRRCHTQIRWLPLPTLRDTRRCYDAATCCHMPLDAAYMAVVSCCQRHAVARRAMICYAATTDDTLLSIDDATYATPLLLRQAMSDTLC